MPDTNATLVEPLTYTLEEFMAELGNERNLSLVRYTYPDGTEQWAANDSWGNLIEWAHTWPELGTKLWGVPVVPRDDTAELVEAVEAYLAAEDHLDATMDDRYEVSDTRDAAEEVIRRKDELRQALSRVRREP